MDEIEKLSDLLDKCNLEISMMSKLTEEDKEGIIYGIDSDEDNPTGNMEVETKTETTTEQGQTSGVKRSGDPTYYTDPYYGIDDDSRPEIRTNFKEFAYRNDYYFDSKKGIQKIPKRYLEKERSITGGILNIDCASNTEQLILTWLNQIKLQIGIKEELISALTALEFFEYIKYKTTGILFNWFENTAFQHIGANKDDKSAEAKIIVLNFISKKIYEEFLGITTLSEIKTKKTDVINYLSNMKICDPCYIENFFCQIKEKYYTVVSDTRTELLPIIESKLPERVRMFIDKKIGDEPKTLGKIERYAKEYRRHLCILREKHQDWKKVKCCNTSADIPQQFGCTQNKYKRTKRYKKPYTKYRTFKKKWKPKYIKRFRKREQKFGKKNCPKGKKNCRCWKCQEIGHYANECPQRNSEKDKKLKMVYSLGLEPIEEEYTEGEVIDFDTYSLHSEISEPTTEYDSSTDYNNESE